MNDVLQLIEPLQFGENVQPIQLSETEVPLDAKLQMVGWMVSDRQGNKTAHLKKVTLNTIKSQECQPFHKKNLSESEFCTRPELEGKFCKVSDCNAKYVVKHEIENLYISYIFILQNLIVSCKYIVQIHVNINKDRAIVYRFKKSFSHSISNTNFSLFL